MSAFVSWSGGKDCMYAMHQYLLQKKLSVSHLVNMCDKSGKKSGSHGLDSELIQLQAKQLDVTLVQKPTTRANYRDNFISVITELKSLGVTTGIFGDIYLEAHREWIEKVCKETGITPEFPLWGMDTGELINTFVNDGFKALVVSVRKEKLDNQWLGRVIDKTFIEEIKTLTGIDPCAEQGEYHTFVTDGPLFRMSVDCTFHQQWEDELHAFLNVKAAFSKVTSGE